MNNEAYRIVIVEDNAPDVFLIETFLEDARMECQLHICSDGQKAFDLIERLQSGKEQPPHCVLLDLNVPMHSSEQILEGFRQSPGCADVPVIVISSSESPKDLARAHAMNAKYFRKPTNINEFRTITELIRQAVPREA